MSELLSKSKENAVAARILIDEKYFYAASVHAAYYSCIQMMIHVLYNFSGKTSAQIDQESTQGSSHAYYIRSVQDLIAQKDANEVNQFTKVKQIKDYRVKSDYKEYKVSQQEAKSVYQMSGTVRDVLTRVFKT